MTTRLGALADRVSGQSFGLSNYDQLEANENYMLVAGADVASAAAITITSRFHGVTGTTAISTITDALGAAEGQVVELWIKNGPLQVQSGTGNIKTATGATRNAYPGEVIGFRYGSDAVWHEIRPVPGARIAYGKQTSPVSTSATSFATGLDLLGSVLNFTADGTSDYLLKVFAEEWSNGSATANSLLEANVDTADYERIALLTSATANAGAPLSVGALISAPAAGVHTVNVRLFVGGGTATVTAGTGGAGNPGPILVTLEVA